MCRCSYVQKCVHVFVNVCMCMNIWVWLCMRLCACICVCMYVSMCGLHMYACVLISVYVYICVCEHVCVCVCAGIYTMIFYIARKNKELLSFSGKCIQLEIIIFYLYSQTQKDKRHICFCLLITLRFYIDNTTKHKWNKIKVKLYKKNKGNQWEGEKRRKEW